MRTVRRVAALLSTTTLAATGLTALTAAPAAAATCSASKTTNVVGARFSYAVCKDGTLLAVEGKLTDTREDGCVARVVIGFVKPGRVLNLVYETGGTRNIEVGEWDATSVKVTVSIRC
ncbi:hypothetical protein ABZX85_14645 [Streptomyces sp. NPDC004539]|uniref:hypothetical protein n=1 Tax=Streptomyces sp. NPDC004539 TaxID=3154280 RepID=UPI0033B6B920